MLLVHGGGWSGGDRTQLRGYGILLGRHGFVSVACEYRLSGEAHWPAQIHDVKAALRWMRANSDRLGIDPARIAVSGNSAGGHLVLISGGRRTCPSSRAMAATRASIQRGGRAVLLSADGVRRPDALSGAVSALMGANARRKRCARRAPWRGRTRTFPPTAFFHGTKDELVPQEASLKMYGADGGGRERGAPHLSPISAARFDCHAGVRPPVRGDHGAVPEPVRGGEGGCVSSRCQVPGAGWPR